MNNRFHGYIIVCLKYIGNCELLGSLAFRRSEGIELGTVLCVVLSSVHVMLVILLFLWRPGSDYLSHLSDG